MCTSLVVNKKKTIVGWNLNLLDMQHRVRTDEQGVYIEVLDATEGWLPLFGANARGDFVGMPTCWPHDPRSDPDDGESENVISLDIDLLMQRKTLAEIKKIAETRNIVSIPGLTFMGALSDAEGNVLHLVPGQGIQYYKKPLFQVLTNFSPFKMDAEPHPWMGWDRYQTATDMLKTASDNFDVENGFAVLRAVSQTVCPTVVSMVFDVKERVVYWCEERRWNEIQQFSLPRAPKGASRA